MVEGAVAAKLKELEERIMELEKKAEAAITKPLLEHEEKELSASG
jgi:hypothetical protein